MLGRGNREARTGQAIPFLEGRRMKIGWIGTGIMGASMAGHLQFAGHELFLYNRTLDKAKVRT